ncbi:hypothetical protein FQN57_004285 [Myotisia sp. PD_48]|nr:hypothetical protein FQN57_004285 [Myotisia sp. PD_48]
MSLNGLDDPAIIESYQSALAEAGGWFLLKYVSRDVVALLAKGNGGVVEIRATIDDSDEKAPLYGFLQYRRRKVILRYVPEGISRLLQARVSVQFQSILDKFSPHDTVFSLAASSELTENALSSACLLHAASSSMTSSTSSLRRRRLGEITEDAEENGPPDIELRVSANTVSHTRSESVFSGISEATAVPTQQVIQDSETLSKSGTDSASRPPNGSPETKPSKPLPSVPRNLTGSRYNGTPQQHLLDQLSQPVPESRKSSQSTRPSLRDLDQTRARQPKVRPVHRPSPDLNARPRTAGSMAGSREARPVASLPAGMRSSTRKQSSSHSNRSQPDLTTTPLYARDIPPLPPLLVPPPPILIGSFSRNPPSSPRSIMSSTSTIGITPEKQRLMKALERRKKQMERQPPASDKKDPVSGYNSEDINIASSVQTTQEIVVTAEPVNCVTPPTETEHPQQTQENNLDTSKQKNHSIEEYNNTQTGQSVEISLPNTLAPDSAVDLTSMHPEDSQKSSKTPADAMKRPGFHSPEALQTSEKRFPDDGTTVYSPTEDINPLQAGSQPTELVEEPSTPGNEYILDNISMSISVSELQNMSDGESDMASKPSTRGRNSSQSSMVDEKQQPASEPHSPAMKSPESICETSLEPATTLLSTDDVTDHGLDDSVRPQNSGELVQKDREVDATSSPSIPNQPQMVNGESNKSLSNSNHGKQIESEGKSLTSSSNTVRGAEVVLSLADKRASHRKEKKEKKPNLDPIQIPSNAHDTDEEYLLSDDSFMEELGSATVQEARPIPVPRTPMTIVNGGSPADAWGGSRIVSNSSIAVHDIQALPIGQNAVPMLVAKKVNVSSGISKRIKALEMFSSREPRSPVVARAEPSRNRSSSPSAFEKFRKRASISQLPIPVSLPSSEKNSPDPKVNIRRQDTQSKRRSQSSNVSVSVTARIVRDPAASPSKPVENPTPEDPPLNLQKSEISVEQTTDAIPRSPPAARSPEHRLSVASDTGSKRNSFHGPAPRSDSISSRLSISSRPKFDNLHSQSSSDATHTPLDIVDETREEKKESRKSRLIRRMSSIASNSRRKGAMNSPVKDQQSPIVAPVQEVETASNPEIAQVVDIGEVNVQFPDTLLWKRRFMRVDERGYLILTPGIIDSNSRNVIKRYHLSEFCKPCLPDHDRQELPNSILLDFRDGSTLQCACESRQGQSAVLQTLLEAHNAHQQT